MATEQINSFMELIYQTIGYKSDNQNPSKQHIETATRNALSVPMNQRFHFRIWFPERQGLVEKYWQWCREHTHYTMSLPLMKYCGHVAVFGYMPARDKVAQANMGRDAAVYPRDCFVKDGRINWFGDWFNERRMELIRDYYLIMGSSAYEYARTLKQLGYFTGFGSCIHEYTQSFYDTFGDDFDGEPFVPVVMVHSGTKAALIKHKTTRQNINDIDVGGALVEVESQPSDKQTLFDGDKSFKNLPYYTTDDDGSLVGITAEQAREMGAYSSIIYRNSSENFL